jgi:hypothetical protein
MASDHSVEGRRLRFRSVSTGPPSIASASLPTFDHDIPVPGVRPFSATQFLLREWLFLPLRRHSYSEAEASAMGWIADVRRRAHPSLIELPRSLEL